jgi:tetratricopeptide (TPR) repeat protein
MSNLVAILLLAVPSASPSAQSDTVAFSKSYELERSGDYKGAVAALEPVGRKSTYLLEYRLGWLYYLAADHVTSRQHYQAAMRVSPKSIEPRLGFILPTLAMGRYDEVETMARTILSMDPNHYTAGLRLAYALRMQRKHRPARDVLTPMLLLYPTDVSLLTEQMINAVNLQSSDLPELCERILALDPKNALAWQYLPMK